MPKSKVDKVPKLRFPGFSDKWEQKNLGEVVEIKSGRSKSNYIDEAGMNVIVDMGAISSDATLIDTKRTNFSGDFIETTELIMAKDDIGGGNIIGKVVTVPNENKYVLGDHVYKLTPRKISTNFLYFAINSQGINQEFRKKANGTAQIGITRSTVTQQDISVPSTEEQKKIADFFCCVDEKIDALQRKKELLETYKKGLMKKIFSQEIRFPGFTEPWQEKELGAVLKFVNGYTFLSKDYSDGEYKIITIANVQRGKLDISKVNTISELPSDIQRQQILEKGDLLISMTGNVGRICRVTADKCLLNQRVGKLVPKKMNSNYVFNYLNDDKFLHAMIAKSQGGAQDNLSSRDILKHRIEMPCNEEQYKIADFLTSIDEVTEAEERKLEYAKQFKKALLQQMFV